MSNKRITDLTELTTPTTDDVFPVVDIATNTTTKVQLANLPVQTAVTTALATKQATLVSGTNIKTVNSNSLLGSGDVAVQPTLVSGANIKTLNSVSLLGAGDIVLAATPSGVSGAIQFSNGSAFASDAANLFWDNTNKRLGVGLNNPTNTFEIASTSASPFRVATTASYFRATYKNSGSTEGIFDYNSTNFQFPTNSVDFGTSTALGARVGIRGSGSTSATTSLLVQNSAGTAALTVRDDLAVIFGGAITSGSITSTAGQIRFPQYLVSGSPFNFGTPSVYDVSGTSAAATSGVRDAFIGGFAFAQSSGTAVMNVFNASPTINQTGGANGITRGLYINPTLTAAADFRAIQTTAGKIIFGGLPTSSAGLVSGQLWNDAGTLKIA
jgi:hypothetical protein